MTDAIEPGSHAGATERIDPLDVLCQLAVTVANERVAWADAEFGLTLPEFKTLKQAATVLILNHRRVPPIVAEVLAKAGQHGGLKP